ncbi:MAG: hypothetical protein ABIP19_08435 [Dermatophilaceae bacterium]
MDETLSPSAAPEPAAFTATRRRLHGIGECLMAGPQRRAGGRFTLRVTPGGFATTGAPALRLDGTELVVGESSRVAVAGTFAEMAEALGVDYGPPSDGYPDGSEASATDDVTLDAASAFLIQDWYLRADAALRVLAPRETPILWPEHFDVAILLNDTSYGASPGDAFHAMPYAYVSSGDHDDSDFWNAPFGAIRGHEQMRSVDDLVSFWRAAEALLRADT